MGFRLRCPVCRGAFPFDPKTEQWPDTCRLKECSAKLGYNERADDDIVMPFIRSSQLKQTDKVYRDMEAASERRMEAAAEMVGAPVSEMSSLKITNLQNASREGDIAAPSVTTELANLGMKSLDDGFKGNGAELSANVQQGPSPNAGAKMRTFLHQQHTNLTGGAAVSDRPALETLQPGYRRRG